MWLCAIPIAGALMAKLPVNFRGRPKRNSDEPVDAEWEEVGDDELEEDWSIRLFFEWLWSELRTGFGGSKVFAALAVIGLLVLMGVLGSGDERAASSQQDRQGSQTSAQDRLSGDPRIAGTYVYATMGGEDGQTRCEDFSNPHLYKRNGEVAELVEFGRDGSYRQLFAYTTPSGEQHWQTSYASWALNGDTLSFTDGFIDGHMGGNVDDYSTPINDRESNVLLVDPQQGKRRLVRCRGDVAGAFGDEPRQSAPQATGQADFAARGTPDFAGLCTNQTVINEVSAAFRRAVMETALSGRLSQAEYTDYQVLLAATAIRQDMDRARLRYLNLRAGNIDDERPQRVTVTCHMDLRVVIPTREAEGIFSEWVQFNDSSFRIRFENPEADGGVAAYYAQVGNPNRPLDVEFGTE